MAHLISVFRFFAASNSLLNYLTWYHHAIYFKKITKASHKPNYPYEMKKKPRKRQSSACVQKILRASVSFSPDEKAKPVNSPVKKNSRLASLSSRNYFQRRVYVWLSSFKMYHNTSHGFCEFFLFENFVICEQKQ